MKCNFKKIGLFAGGVLFGTAGVKVLSSKDAKKVYTHTTAAVLRAKESIMSVVTKTKENAEDILADAKDINEKQAAEDEMIIEDCCCCETVAEEAEEVEETAETEAE